MITIDLLNNHPQAIPALAAIWYEVLGKVWVPEVPVEQVIERFKAQLNESGLPMTFVAFDGTKPIGMCSLRSNDGIRPELTPWLGSLVVDPQYQNLAVGKRLIDVTKKQANELGYEKLYLFAFDETIPDYYADLGWHKIGMDVFNKHPVTVMEYYLLSPKEVVQRTPKRKKDTQNIDFLGWGTFCIEIITRIRG